MKLLFKVEEYEDMKDFPFEVDSYFCDRLYIYIVENGQKQYLLNSTFHDGILLEIGNCLIKLGNGKITSGTVETNENALVYTFNKSEHRLFIDCFDQYDSSRQKVLEYCFTDFVKAYEKEYQRYIDHILKQDENAYDNDIFVMMLNQIEELRKIP